MKRIAVTSIFMFILSGCSAYKVWYGSDKPMMSYVIINEKGEVHHGLDAQGKPIVAPAERAQGYIITWSPEYNGAFVSPTGKGCIQPAMYATTASGDAAIPLEIFTSGASGSLEGSYTEALEKLIKVTDQSTFMSIGMYGICQLSAAEALTKEDAARLVELLLKNAATISTESDEGEGTATEVTLGNEAER